jgi:nucleoside-diphosphate-sugar epimerase
MIEKNCDLLFFGYGEITDNLMKRFASEGLKIICVSDRHENTSIENVIFLKRFEVIKYRIVCKNVFFAWRTTEALTKDNSFMGKWILESLHIEVCSFVLSSASLYKDSHFPVTESDENLDIYATNNPKYLLENEVSKLMNLKAVPVSNLRISNIYGFQIKYGFIGSLVESAKTNRAVPVFTETEFVRDYLSVNDLYAALKKIIENRVNLRVLNLSTAIGLDVQEVIEILQSHSIQIKYQFMTEPSEKHRKYSILDNSLVKSVITWNPVTLHSGVRFLHL